MNDRGPRWADVVVLTASLLALIVSLYCLAETHALREQTETYIRWSIHVSAVTDIPLPESERDHAEAPEPDQEATQQR